MALISATLGTFPTTLMVPFTASAGVIITPSAMICFKSVTLLISAVDAEFLDGLFRELRQGFAFGAAGANDEYLHDVFLWF